MFKWKCSVICNQLLAEYLTLQFCPLLVEISNIHWRTSQKQDKKWDMVEQKRDKLRHLLENLQVWTRVFQKMMTKHKVYKRTWVNSLISEKIESLVACTRSMPFSYGSISSHYVHFFHRPCRTVFPWLFTITAPGLDGRTNRPTDRTTDIVGNRVACSLEIWNCCYRVIDSSQSLAQDP